MTIADRIQNLRKTRGISQEELADRIGVSRQAVSKWESQQSTPDVEKIILLSEYFGVTTDYLLKGIEPLAQEDGRNNNVHTMNLVATALDLLGIMMSCLIWPETVNVGPIIAGVVFLVLGVMVYMIGIIQISGQQRVLAKCRFWKLNIWLIVFLLLSVIWNTVTVQMPAPYPLVHENTYHLFAIFWIIYFGVCGIVMRICMKKEKENSGKHEFVKRTTVV